MRHEQMEMFPPEVQKGYRLHQHLLDKGERPDTRPWGGRFDNDSPTKQAKTGETEG